MLYFRKNHKTLSISRFVLISLMLTTYGVRTAFELSNVPFVSQNDQLYFPKISCGAASLSMMLQYNNIFIDYKKLVDELKIEKNNGTTLVAIKSFLQKNNWNHFTFLQKKELKNFLRRGPIAALIAPRDSCDTNFINKIYNIIKNNKSDDTLKSVNYHWIVLIGYDDKGFIYLDPSRKKSFQQYKQKIPYKEFYKKWNIAIQVQA